MKRVQIGDMDYTGDEVRDSLGLLSSCFHFSSADGKIRVSSIFQFVEVAAGEVGTTDATLEEYISGEHAVICSAVINKASR